MSYEGRPGSRSNEQYGAEREQPACSRRCQLAAATGCGRLTLVRGLTTRPVRPAAAGTRRHRRPAGLLGHIRRIARQIGLCRKRDEQAAALVERDAVDISGPSADE